ncbi:PH domain-containing protein DDB_G0275795-like isoform X1 [Aricia agestis]|uniref:PH domain-containing protein DDB_G0275795-like isoform X1 n=1 Tax=Aricia agestis TaxID=91739 RepID=UPI001C20AF5C|nr:PH domain-containing protein DDB_G0275795-like isoform X1 [Aricia agestis]
METETIIMVSVLSAAWLVLLAVCAVLASRIASLRRQLEDLNASGRLRVQKLTMSTDKHAFNNPTLSPDEELSRRGYSMYQPDDDVESGRGTERYSTHSPSRMQAYHTQTGGQFVDELAREIDYRQQRQSSQHNMQQQQNNMSQQQNNVSQQRNSMTQQQPPQPQQQQPSPPFLLQSIESSKKIRALANPVAAQGRQSDTNPNFMY